MKAFVGILIVGIVLSSHFCNAEEFDARQYIKITLITGKTFICSESEISNGCKIYVDKNKLLTLENYPSVTNLPIDQFSFSLTYKNVTYSNYKFNLNRVKEIEYR